MENLRTRTARWYEVTAVVDRVQDDGSEKKVKEIYVSDSMSCTEAEVRVMQEVNEGEAVKVQLLPATEFIFEETEPADVWYKVKVQIITLDERSGKEKKASQLLYVQAKDLATARTHVVDIFDGTPLDYNVVSISETNILEVYEHNVEEK